MLCIKFTKNITNIYTCNIKYVLLKWQESNRYSQEAKKVNKYTKKENPTKKPQNQIKSQWAGKWYGNWRLPPRYLLSLVHGEFQCLWRHRVRRQSHGDFCIKVGMWRTTLSVKGYWGKISLPARKWPVPHTGSVIIEKKTKQPIIHDQRLVVKWFATHIYTEWSKICQFKSSCGNNL